MKLNIYKTLVMGNVKIRIAFQQRQTEHNRLANIDGSLTLYDFFPAYNK